MTYLDFFKCLGPFVFLQIATIASIWIEFAFFAGLFVFFDDFGRTSRFCCRSVCMCVIELLYSYRMTLHSSRLTYVWSLLLISFRICSASSSVISVITAGSLFFDSNASSRSCLARSASFRRCSSCSRSFFFFAATASASLASARNMDKSNCVCVSND